MTVLNNFSTLLTVDIQNMFDELFRYPIGTIGYYSLGVLLAIFYFEYSQSISNRDLRKTRAYKVLDYIGKSRVRCTNCQIIGAIICLGVIFARYFCFASFNEGISPQAIDRGRWPVWMNGLFNAFAHYIFIASIVMICLPIFIGKLSIIREILGAPFFRPFARTNFTFACYQGVGLLIIFFS
jgi:hypothetical protein